MKPIFLFILFSYSIFAQNNDVMHYYKLNIIDIDGNPLQDVTVKFKLYNLYEFVKDTIILANKKGEVLVSVKATPNPKYKESFNAYSTSIFYDVIKPNFYTKSSVQSSDFGGRVSRYKSDTKEDFVILLKFSDYIEKSFYLSKEYNILKNITFEFIDYIISEAFLSDSDLVTQSIILTKYKNNKYFALSLNNNIVYNSLKLNKYGIGEKIFDEIIRKILEPLNNNLGNIKDIYGYDVTIFGYIRNFSEENKDNTKIIYRFLIPKEIVKKYKKQDITGQQVIDASTILMDNERIDLRLK